MNTISTREGVCSRDWIISIIDAVRLLYKAACSTPFPPQNCHARVNRRKITALSFTSSCQKSANGNRWNVAVIAEKHAFVLCHFVMNSILLIVNTSNNWLRNSLKFESLVKHIFCPHGHNHLLIGLDVHDITKYKYLQSQKKQNCFNLGREWCVYVGPFAHSKELIEKILI